MSAAVATVMVATSELLSVVPPLTLSAAAVSPVAAVAAVAPVALAAKVPVAAVATASPVTAMAAVSAAAPVVLGAALVVGVGVVTVGTGVVVVAGIGASLNWLIKNKKKLKTKAINCLNKLDLENLDREIVGK